jgi:hypothetical protein
MPDLKITVELGEYSVESTLYEVDQEALRPDASARDGFIKSFAWNLDVLAEKIGIYDRFAESFAAAASAMSAADMDRMLTGMPTDLRGRVERALRQSTEQRQG